MVLSLADISVWCFACDSYIDNHVSPSLYNETSMQNCLLWWISGINTGDIPGSPPPNWKFPSKGGVERHFYAHEKVMWISQNGPLEKRILHIIAFLSFEKIIILLYIIIVNFFYLHGGFIATLLCIHVDLATSYKLRPPQQIWCKYWWNILVSYSDYVIVYKNYYLFSRICD